MFPSHPARSTRATQAQAASGPHVGQPAQTLHQKQAMRPATSPRSAWAAGQHDGRSVASTAVCHEAPKNATTIWPFFKAISEMGCTYLKKYHLHATWSPAYISETKPNPQLPTSKAHLLRRRITIFFNRGCALVRSVSHVKVLVASSLRRFKCAASFTAAT